MEYYRGLILGYDLVDLFINDLEEETLESVVHSQSSLHLTSDWDDIVYLGQWDLDKWMKEEQEPCEIQ